MKKVLDKLINNVKFDKRYVFFMLVIVILGIITGSLFIIILNSADKELVREYISDYIGNINNQDNLYNNIMLNYSIAILISVIGFTYFLFPLNILILFYKAFVIGFSISSFIMCYKFKGLILSIVYVFPHHILNILFLSLITAFTVKLSIKMINHILKRHSVDLRLYFNKYICMLFMVSILFIFTTLYETYIIPPLLNFLLKMLHI